MGSKTKYPSNTTSETQPWAGQQPYLSDAFAKAKAINEAPGSRIAPFTTEQQQALDLGRDYTTQALPQLVNQTQGAFNFGLTAPNISQNPFFEQNLQASLRPIEQSLTEKILPQIRSGAIDTGQYGGSRQGLVEGIALRDAMQSMGDVAAKMGNEAYTQGLDTMEKSMMFSPQMLNLGYAPSEKLFALGQTEQSMNQAMLDEDARRLQEYYGIVGESPWGGISSNTGPQVKNNPWAGALGGAMAMSNLGWIGGPMGAIVGALLGSMV